METRSHSETFVALLLIFTSLTFVLQPTNIRFGGMAISIVLMGLCVCVGFLIDIRKIETRGLIFWAICAVLLFEHDIQDNANSVATTKALAFLILLLFVLVCPALSLSERWLQRGWQSVAVVCGCLALIALLRFVMGYEELNPDSLTGELVVKDRYSYVGISYLPATRNSDAFYFGIGALASLWAAINMRRLRVMFVALTVVCGLALVGSLSRGAWLAGFAAIAVAYSPPMWFYLMPLSGAAAIMLINTSNMPMLNLIKVGLISLVNPTLANETVHGFYSYSNENRLILYSDAVYDALMHPLGIGFSGESALTDFSAAGVTHSENIYLDIILGVGWIGVIVPFLLYSAIRTACHVNAPARAIALSVLTFTAIFCLFNGGVDFAFMWFCTGLALITIAAQPGRLTGVLPSVGGHRHDL